jgi:esterase/lipase superfamily enzyme
MHKEHLRWDSTSLGRPMDLIWYGTWGRPVLMFPTSLGGPSQNEDGGIIGALADKIDGGEIQVCCVDSVDEESWYNRGAHPGWRVHRHDQYDRYLASEAVPFVRDKARREDIIVYGSSFGGYHAVNFAFRHPDLVARAISFSGVYDIHRFLDGYWDETCYFHCPTAYIPNFSQEWVGRVGGLGTVIATGEHDHLVQDNRDFAGLLASKGIPVYHEIWSGVSGHDWPWWREHLRRFLP